VALKRAALPRAPLLVVLLAPAAVLRQLVVVVLVLVLVLLLQGL
jgi:hypothetical protein